MERENNKSIIISKDNPSIIKDDNKCINCGLCRICCLKKVGVFPDKDCINCGQCIFSCPVHAITPKYEYMEVEKILKLSKKVVIAITSPALKVTFGDEFDMEKGSKVDGKLVAALRKLGFNYVFDTSFGADLTTMEEANELINRINTNTNLPMFTSCCPSWVKYAVDNHKELLNNISTCKSPIAMFSTIIKEYFSNIKKIDKNDIVVVAITPCTSKKYERILYPETDYVLTSSELGIWLKEKEIDFMSLISSEYDDLFSKTSGGGIIFGSTGGVTESVMRTVYYMLTGKDSKTLLCYDDVRGYKNFKTASITIDGIKILIAVIYTMPALEEFLEKEDYKKYHFIEVMNCPGGCIGGAGNSYIKQVKQEEFIKKRMESLYEYDNSNEIRYSYKNKDIIDIYDNFLKGMDSDMSIKLLHTNMNDEEIKC